MEKVSIILPVFNCEKYLKHTIASVQAQVYKNWELLIVDDASTDASLVEARRFAAEDSRIKVISLSKNAGVGACRNIALARATGEYVAFIDSDDLWAKEKLSRQIVFMKKRGIGLSHTAYAYINAKGEVMSRGQNNVDECIGLKRYMKTTQIGMSTVMIDRRLINGICFPEDRELSADARLWMSFLRKGEKFYGLNQILMLYRIREKQLSLRKDKMALLAFKRYTGEKTLSLAEQLCCFAHYAYNGIRKRKCKRTMSLEYAKENFNCH